MALRDRAPEDTKAALARTVLALTDDPGLPDETFRWGVEGLLLPLAPRPSHPSWAETYLKRTPSGVDLLRRLIAPDYRKLGVLAWINQARGRGEVSPEQAARVDACLDYARALNSRDPNSLLKVHVPGVAPEERGVLLGQMLTHVGGASLEGLPFVLDACRDAWPGAFDAGKPGLRTLATPLARCLNGLRLPPAPWLARVTQILERLGLTNGPRGGFEPDGLAAEVAASAARLVEGQPSPWPLRQYLFRDDSAWRILTADIRRDLIEVKPEAAPDVLDRWDKALNDRPDRFFELFLNACDGPRLASSVTARAADLRTLPPLPWWDHTQHVESRNDLRDGFARIVPLAPLVEGRLFVVRNWVEGPAKRATGSNEAGPAVLSPQGLARWRCLEALTNFQNAGREPEVRWPVVQSWKADLPVLGIPPDDRYRLLAWVILGLDAAESYQLAELASWLRKVGFKDPERLNRWAEEVEGLTEVSGQIKLFRTEMVRDLRTELSRLLREGQESKGLRTAGPERK